MVLLWIISVVAESQKSKMAASKPDILISQLLDKIETKFQRLTLHFRGPATQWEWLEYCATKTEAENPIWRPTFPLCRPPSWIFHFRFGLTVFPLAPFSCWTSEMYGYPLKFRRYLVLERRYKYFRFRGRHLEFPTSGYTRHYQK